PRWSSPRPCRSLHDQGARRRRRRDRDAASCSPAARAFRRAVVDRGQRVEPLCVAGLRHAADPRARAVHQLRLPALQPAPARPRYDGGGRDRSAGRPRL
ncbi:hypothetical protein LTR94_030506, partial [Friedmanniomyces endolithicus]